MTILLFVLSVLASFIVMMVGAVALEITGMQRIQARFQALSAFTGCGFTTSESDLIMCHPARRKVVTVLMFAGSAGMVAMIGTLASSVGANASRLNLPWELFWGITVAAPFVPYVKVLIFILGVTCLYRMFLWKPLNSLLWFVMRKWVTRLGWVEEVTFEEVLLGAGDFGVSKIEMSADNPLINRALMHSDLKEKDILVLMIETPTGILAPPPADHRAAVGEVWTLFGPLKSIKEIAVVPEQLQVSKHAEMVNVRA